MFHSSAAPSGKQGMRYGVSGCSLVRQHGLILLAEQLCFILQPTSSVGWQVREGEGSSVCSQFCVSREMLSVDHLGIVT